MSRPSQLMSKSQLKRYRNAGMLPDRDAMNLTDYQSVGGLLYSMRLHSVQKLVEAEIGDKKISQEEADKIYKKYYFMSIDELEVEMNMLKLKEGRDEIL